MISHLFDTCIIIDYLRDRPDAIAFLEGQDDPPALSVITVAELYEGVRPPEEAAILSALLARFGAFDVTPAIARQAGLWSQQYRRSHGVGMADALIAATALAHEVRLVTRNVRHFPMLEDVLVPYQ